ncbi:MAG: SCO family protein [Candidatus Baltobacteraceae bacterium]
MRYRGPAAGLLMLIACAIAACTNGGGLSTIGGNGGGGTPSPLPSQAIGVAIPTGKIGVVNDPTWGTVSGYTQNQTSQVLAFPPGAKITVTNLSSVDPHTLNVIAVASAPPANFPPSPSISFYPNGHGVLGPGYASGTLNPGSSITVTLKNPGIYLIGCAYHYVEFAMRDVIQVVAGATPGPTASPGKGAYAIPAPTSLPTQRRTIVSRPRLVDQLGRSFELSSMRGTPFAVTFISAHCNDACPLINGQFASAARRIESDRLPGRLLTITLDPEHDTPSSMRELARRFDANPRYWLLAAGKRSDVHEVMREFGVVSVEGKDGRDDRHTTFVYLFDASGNFVKTILASSVLDDAIVDALRDHSLAAKK